MDAKTFSDSGLRMTMYGATGFIGNTMSGYFGSKSSDILYPVRPRLKFDDRMKCLKVNNFTGTYYVNRDTDFYDIASLDRMNRNSDIVINMIGPSRYNLRSLDRFKEANMETPQRIARSARRSGVKQFIHFSSVGVDPKSDSMDLQTKYYGEQLVLDEFPEAVIIRPTLVMGEDDYFLDQMFSIWKHWSTFIPVYDNLLAKKQPILVEDLAQVVGNIIQMKETQGKIYEIGGPFVYTQKQIYEMFMTEMEDNFKLMYIPRSLALKFTDFVSFRMMSREDITKSRIDFVVNPTEGVGTIEDLFVQPNSIASYMKRFCYKKKKNMAITKFRSEV